MQTVKVKGSGGTDGEITYYGNASAKSSGTFKFGTPDAKGIAPLIGSGHDTGGTGKAKGLKSTYTFSGTLNTKTGVYNVTLRSQTGPRPDRRGPAGPHLDVRSGWVTADIGVGR